MKKVRSKARLRLLTAKRTKRHRRQKALVRDLARTKHEEVWKPGLAAEAMRQRRRSECPRHRGARR